MDQMTAMAFIFPGQGSQTVGMLKDFAVQQSSFRETYNEVSGYLGYDLWQIVENGPESELNRTEITQPALLTAGVAIWRLWCEAGGATPQYMAGHSLGEYTALVCAGSIMFKDAVTLVRDRGIYMQTSVAEAEGAMAALIGIDKEKVNKVCEEASTVGFVSAANYNSPEQTVIAGQVNAVKRAIQFAKQSGAKRAVLLPVSVPSHCRLMEPAAEQLAARLDGIDISDATIPVIQNVDARPHQNAAEIRVGLIKQLTQPVLWVDTIHRIVELNCFCVIESGPGKVLSGLIKRIIRDLDVLNLNTTESFNSAINYEKS
jgi:[acyl-carrier-protein] S-malonyltransferase